MMAAMSMGNVYFDLTEELNAEGSIVELAERLLPRNPLIQEMDHGNAQ